MKFIEHLVFFMQLLSLFFLAGCFELFPEETLVYEGKVVEGLNGTKPVEGVLVQGCTKNVFNLFPSLPSCDAETLTNSSGYFYLSFVAKGSESRGLLYSKEGYRSLDSCRTLSDGTYECYIEAKPTVFRIYSPTSKEPFTYDSLKVNVATTTKDTIVHYFTGSYINTNGGTSYYWKTNRPSKYRWNESYTSIIVENNSSVKIHADYYKNDSLKLTDLDSLFCPKGIGNKYRILN